MALRLTIPRHEIRIFQVLKDLGNETLTKLLEALNAGLWPDHSVFVKRVASVVGDSVASACTGALLRLAAVRRRNEASPAEVIEALTADLERQKASTRWTDEDLEKWKAVKPQVAALLALESVVVLEKALELSYAFPQLFSDARILTDVRPVFNEAGDALRAAVVTNTLEISYTEEGQPKVIRLAIDAEDLKQLVRACERARTKTRAARDKMSLDVPTIVAGVDDTD